MMYMNMKLLILGTVLLTGLAVTPDRGSAQSKPSYRFACETYNGVSNVVVATTQGKKVPIFAPRFYSNYWNASRRCNNVYPRFQHAYDNGELELMRVGTINGRKVICSSQVPGLCTRLLITLLPNDNAHTLLQTMLANNQMQSPSVIQANGFWVKDLGITYFNIGRYLSHQARDR